jgi:hypothetical protein
MDEFKLDRTAFKAQTIREAADHAQVYSKMTWQERLRVAAYLNSVAYNYDLHNPPRMDKTKFAARAMKK